jgi:hypothetical protein
MAMSERASKHSYLGGTQRTILPRPSASARRHKYGYEHPLNEVAQEFGYKSITSVPDKELGKVLDRAVNRYGKRSVRGMIQRQLVYRKGREGLGAGRPSKTKFLKLRRKLKTV